jgi:hypothetical protein
MNVFDLNLTKNCKIILCTFLLYSANKLSFKQIKCLRYLIFFFKELSIVLPVSSLVDYFFQVA